MFEWFSTIFSLGAPVNLFVYLLFNSVGTLKLSIHFSWICFFNKNKIEYSCIFIRNRTTNLHNWFKIRICLIIGFTLTRQVFLLASQKKIVDFGSGQTLCFISEEELCTSQLKKNDAIKAGTVIVIWYGILSLRIDWTGSFASPLTVYPRFLYWRCGQSIFYFIHSHKMFKTWLADLPYTFIIIHKSIIKYVKNTIRKIVITSLAPCKKYVPLKNIVAEITEQANFSSLFTVLWQKNRSKCLTYFTSDTWSELALKLVQTRIVKWHCGREINDCDNNESYHLAFTFTEGR